MERERPFAIQGEPVRNDRRPVNGKRRSCDAWVVVPVGWVRINLAAVPPLHGRRSRGANGRKIRPFRSGRQRGSEISELKLGPAKEKNGQE